MPFNSPMELTASLAFYLLEVLRNTGGTPLRAGDVLEFALQRRLEDGDGRDPMNPEFQLYTALMLEDMARLGLIRRHSGPGDEPLFSAATRESPREAVNDERVASSTPDGCDSGIQEVLLHPVLFCVEPDELDPILASATERF
jgi:hypothetical protein